MNDSEYIPRPSHFLIPSFILILGAVVLGYFHTWQAALAFIGLLVICMYAGYAIAYAMVSHGKAAELREGTFRMEEEREQAKLEMEVQQVTPVKHMLQYETHMEEDEDAMYAVRNFYLDIEPYKLKKLADELLGGTRTLAETEWGDTFPVREYREIKKQMFTSGLIEYANKRNDRGGFILTQRGILFLYQYASDGVRADPRLRVLVSAQPLPPTEPVTTPRKP